MLRKLTKLFLVMLFFMLPSLLMAQANVGKIIGKITDEETGEPVQGATIILKGTNKGAKTDLDGSYFILNIVPGTYEVEIKSIGYKTKIVEEVRVVGGITYELNATLSKGDIQLKVVEVKAKKLVEEKATNTVKVVDANDIARLPVRGVENVAALQAGVVKSGEGADRNATLNVRGGRGGEVLFIVDGVPQNDIFGGGNASQVSSSAIEQMTFQVGGFEAKFGQAQSGIISVTTKRGSPTYAVFGDVVTSSFTDIYGYNLYTLNLSGPFVPGNADHTFFISGERGWFREPNPSSQKIYFGSIGKEYKVRPNASSGIWRLTARTNHNFGDFNVRLGANINTRDNHSYVHTYAKNNTEHNPRQVLFNGSYNLKLSQNVSSTTYWNLNIGYKKLNYKTGDGVHFDRLWDYGDSLLNSKLIDPDEKYLSWGYRMSTDKYGMFYKKGRVSNSFVKRDDDAFNIDFDFTSQINKHLFEFGAGINYNILRYYGIAPAMLAYYKEKKKDMPIELIFHNLQPYFFGYDITGSTKTSVGSSDENKTITYENETSVVTTKQAPKTPIIAYAYVQDKYELNDLVLNLGLRMDYFDTKAKVLKDMSLPYAGGSDPNAYDDGDFTDKKPEIKFSPRIGLGFPVTDKTVFHAQYGKFIQQPPLSDVYTNVYELNMLITDQNWSVTNGDVNSEVTTQYELGFSQIFGDNTAALKFTAYYKNTRGLLNNVTYFFYRDPNKAGQVFRYIGTTNTDFGTVKGVAITVDVPKISYFSLNIDYTYSIAEGTGSSTSSNFVAAFRNDNGQVPKVIAPLDFDQRHTGIVNLNFYAPKGQLGVFELVNANLLFSFASGRPYTPLESQNLIAGSTNFGDTKGYVNSATGPGNYRFDLKVEKAFMLSNLTITPYIWIENLFNTRLVNSVYQSTGDPETTGWLETEEAKTIITGKGPIEGKNYAEDYKSLERTPGMFSIPRLIKLGVKVNFTNIKF